MTLPLALNDVFGKTQFLADSIEPDLLDTPLDKGKSVQSQFAHLVSVRKMWLNAAKLVLSEQSEMDKWEATKASLLESSNLLVTCMESAIGAGKKPCGHPGGAEGFLAYFAAHEAFHWAQIELALRQAGHPLPDKIVYQLWK